MALRSEEAKIALSDNDAVEISLERLRSKTSKGCQLHVDQAGFQNSVAQLIANIEQAVAKTVQDAQIRLEDIDTVFFTGGASGVRGLRQRIGAILPGAKKVEGDLFGSIGAGLGLAAWRRYR